MPLQDSDIFLVNGGDITSHTSTVPYISAREYDPGSGEVTFEFPEDGWDFTGISFPRPFEFDTYPVYQSDAEGNRIGTASGTVYNVVFYPPGPVYVRTMRADNAGSISDWSDTGYITFELPGDMTKSSKVQAQNLFNGNFDTAIVLVQDDTQSYKCKVADLPNKASDTRFMLVNQGGTSYKVKSSTVIDQYGPPKIPWGDFIASAYVEDTWDWVDSSGNGNDLRLRKGNFPRILGDGALSWENNFAYREFPTNLPPGSQYTYEVWLKNSNTIGYRSQVICQCSNNPNVIPDNSSYQFMIYDGRRRFLTGVIGDTQIWNAFTGADTAYQTDYHHIVALFDGAAVKIYVDNRLKAISFASADISTDMNVFKLCGGSANGWQGNTQGTNPSYGFFTLQRARIWFGSSLTEEEIAVNYQEFLDAQP